MSKVYCIIPARMAASRFPGKPLKVIRDKSMIEHVYKRCALCEDIDEVIVATCDNEIKDEVERIGGKATMTSDSHERCTDRVEEAINKLDSRPQEDDLIIMVQGDEVFVTPEMLSELINSFKAMGAGVLNIVSPMFKMKDVEDQNAVKVTMTKNGHVIYMSRSVIPSTYKKVESGPIYYQQMGVIAFSLKLLRQFSATAQTTLEKIESIDMLRFIENEIPIMAIKAKGETISIDTLEDLKRATIKLEDDPTILRY
ncbi:MAG: 3-deoxy-manno-octulosonate cytidylyltransferase [Bacteriovoracaceae bacterium]|nr:3-deoxy-manno-octulosonate cytidylyltransferase [Bacteriovoracaceae bacterium]